MDKTMDEKFIYIPNYSLCKLILCVEKFELAKLYNTIHIKVFKSQHIREWELSYYGKHKHIYLGIKIYTIFII